MCNNGFTNLSIIMIILSQYDTYHNSTINTYSTAQFKLYTHMQVHVCACTLNACKTSKTGMCIHCCTQFWHTHAG